MAVESRFGSCVLRTFSVSNAILAREDSSPKRVGVVGLSRTPPILRSWRCSPPRAAKATAGVVVVGEMTSMPGAAAIV